MDRRSVNPCHVSRPRPAVPHPWTGDQRAVLEFLDLNRHKLTAWERGFVTSLLHRAVLPTARQWTVARRMGERCGFASHW